MDIDIPYSDEILIYLIEGARECYNFPEEIIPNYTEKEIEELLMCIKRVYQGYYATLEERISSILFNITKGHFLSNGNKRIATIFKLVFYIYELKNKPLDCKYEYESLNPSDLKDLVVEIACGSVDKEQTLNRIKVILNSNFSLKDNNKLF